MKVLDEKHYTISDLLDLMARLRNPEQGCPWDQAQNFDSIAPYTLEEAYEVADAIARKDFAGLCGELGDLLFQVVFHARMAEEGGHFSFADVVNAIVHKMIRRHPHVFGDEKVGDHAEQMRRWDELKAQEKDGSDSVLADVPVALPALVRAQKLQRRASRLGLDWPAVEAVVDKLDEERTELEEALKQGKPEQHHELGDLLFTAVNLARHLHLDADAALRDANQRFTERVQGVEALAARDGIDTAKLTPAQLDQLWCKAKSVEQV